MIGWSLISGGGKKGKFVERMRDIICVAQIFCDIQDVLMLLFKCLA
jgi:hypothetical protein